MSIAAIIFAQASAHSLQTGIFASCLRHSASQSLHTALHTCASSLACFEFAAASVASACEVASVSRTAAAHAAIEVSPLPNIIRQWVRQASALRSHSDAASASDGAAAALAGGAPRAIDASASAPAPTSSSLRSMD